MLMLLVADKFIIKWLSNGILQCCEKSVISDVLRDKDMANFAYGM
jgi:hypothetical protein